MNRPDESFEICREVGGPRLQNYQVEFRELEPMLVGGIRMKGYYSDCGQGFKLLGRRLGRHLAGKPLCLFYDGEYREGDADFEPCMPLRKPVEAEGISVRELPGGRCLTLMHIGTYEHLRESYDRLRDFIKERGCQVLLPTREVYHKGPGMIFRGNPQKFLTEIQMLLAE
jgi:effector-binding domain-containing protein